MSAAVRKLALFALIVLAFLGPTIAEGQASRYSDSSDGLHDLIQHIALTSSSDPQESSRLAATLAVPDPESWFKETFGPEAGEKIYKSYYYSHATTDLRVINGVRKFSQQADITIQVVQIETANEEFADIGDAELFTAMKKPMPFYRVHMTDNKTGIKQYIGGYFFYLQGGFRNVADVFGPVVGPISNDPGEPLLKIDDQGNVVGSEQLGPVSRIRLNAGDMESRLIYRAEPVYPEEALKARMEGPVQMRVIVNENGSVGEVRIIVGRQTLLKTAIETVRKWRYKPVLLNGRPVQVDTIVTILFKLPAVA